MEKQKHILYCSICTPTQNAFAQEVSAKYGYGSEDHAIVLSEQFKEPCFTHQIDFRSIGGSKMSYASYIQRDHLKTAIDDELLKKILPYAMQAMDTLCRQQGFETNYKALERCFLSGIGFWAAYLRHHKIELVVFFVVPHEGNDFLLYQVCRALEIPTLIYELSLCQSRCYVTYTIEYELPALVSHYEKLRKEYADCPIEQIPLDDDYREKYEKMTDPKRDKTPSYMKPDFIANQNLSWYLIGYATYDTYLRNRKNSGQLKGVPLRVWARAMVYRMSMFDLHLTGGVFIKALLRIKNKEYKKTQELWQYYKSCSQEPDYTKKYVYYPLHFQPECTSNPQGGGVYYQQMIPVRILAESLPEDVFVYVKEHPVQVYGAREKGFYDELRSIPNVILVKPDTDTYELIKHSIAVSTLIGTAGWEGLFFGKPFLMFGYWVTQHMPGVYHIRTKEECRAAIDAILRGECQFTLKDIKLFFKALGDTEGWVLSPELDLTFLQPPEKQISSCLKLFEQAMGL